MERGRGGEKERRLYPTRTSRNISERESNGIRITLGSRNETSTRLELTNFEFLHYPPPFPSASDYGASGSRLYITAFIFVRCSANFSENGFNVSCVVVCNIYLRSTSEYLSHVQINDSDKRFVCAYKQIIFRHGRIISTVHTAPPIQTPTEARVRSRFAVGCLSM